jgi:signal recognition particle subunit SRP54
MVLAELGGQLREALRQLHKPGSSSKAKVQALIQDLTRALIAADVQLPLVQKLRQNVLQKVEPHLPDDEDESEGSNVSQARTAKLTKLVQQAVVNELVALLTPKDPSTNATIQPYKLRKGKSNIILFVGLQGAGKTTSVAKYARYYQRRGWKTAMVCADTFRAGALDQLKQNATKLRIPFYGSYRQADPVVIAQEGVAQFKRDGYEVILVDTSGRHQQEAALFDEMQELAAAVEPHNTILVLDATQGQAVYDQARAFHAAVPVGAVIATKLDGHAKGGGALSAVAATQSPIVFLGQGEHFDDLQPFAADSFVSQLLGMGDVKGLIQALRGDDENNDDQKELQERMRKGEFTLRMMYQQFDKILSLGSLGKLAGMMPSGMPQYLMPNGAGDKEATGRLRKFMVIMDSMRDVELDGGVDWHNKTGTADPGMLEKRRRRIAAGAGCHPTEVLMLLQAHKQFEAVVQKMKGLQGNKQQMAQQKQMAAQWRKNPALMQQHLNQMDPKLVAQMGGREAVLSAMQQMARGGGAGGGADMNSLMGGGFPGMPSMPPGGIPGGSMPGGAMPDMNTMMQQMQQMGLGAAGGPGGGMPDMATMQRMMQQMGMGGR